MTDFETETVLDVVVDEGSLRDARRTVEDGMSDLMVGVDASGAGTGGTGGSGVSRVLGDQQRTLDTVSGHSEDLVTLAETRNDLLEELVETVEGAGGGGLGLRGRRPGGGLGGLGGLGGILGILGVAGVAAASGGDIEAPTLQVPEIPALDVPPIPEPVWAPVDVAVPDWLPLGVPEPDWLPVEIPHPDWLPGEQPTPSPSPSPTPTPTPTSVIDTAEIAQDAFAAQDTHDFGEVFGAESRVDRPLDAAADTSGRITGRELTKEQAAGAITAGALTLGARVALGGGGSAALSGGAVLPPASTVRNIDRRLQAPPPFRGIDRRFGAETTATGHAQNQLPSEKRGSAEVNVETNVTAEGVTERDIEEAMERAKQEAVEGVRREVGGLGGGLSDPFR